MWTMPVATIVLAAGFAVADYRSLDPAPVAVEGGVLLVPIAAEGEAMPPGDWPAEIPVELDDGRRANATIGWLEPWSDPRPATWTASGETFTVVERPETPDAVPVLLVDMPAAYRGGLRWAGDAVSPRWLPPAAPRAREPRAAASEWAEALPDPAHPLEWFRWVLLAERVGDEPPPPPGDAAGRLAARHLAEVWRAAIARVGNASPGVAEELRQRLTSTCTLLDGSGSEREIAAWIADPRDLRSLLAIALDPERDDAAAMQAVLAWLRTESPLLLSPVEALGDEVAFLVANPGTEQVVLRCRWLEDDPVPIAVVVRPRTAQQILLKRPVREGVSSDGGVLFIEHGPHRQRLEFGERPGPVRPPGASIGTFQRPLSLAALQSGRGSGPPPTRGAAAELRRRQGRWELFIECFRPADARKDELTLRIGDAAAPTAVLRVPETGVASSGEAEVHRASHADRWRCRIVLPDRWLAEGLVGTRAPGVGFSVERRLTLAGGEVERSAVGPASPPWRDVPATEVRDLSSWPRGPGDAGRSQGADGLGDARILAP